MRALITGITGFVGGHLADYLNTQKGVEVYGISRHNGQGNWRGYACDMRDAKKVEKLIRQIKPDRIFHLAGQASVPLSWSDPKGTFEENLISTVNLLEAVLKARLGPRIQLAGSAHEYGIPPKPMRRIDESAPMNPLSPYAVSKVSQDFLACQYARRFNMKIVRTRAFNHVGPGQSEAYVTSSMARQIALIEAGHQKPEILAGNLDTIRDYTDVRDVVRAYWLALEKGKAGEAYNIASGRGHSAREILELYLKLTPVKIKVRQDPGRLRQDDLARLVGNPGKFIRRTGWKPKINFKDSLKDILNFWRKKVKNG